MASEVEASVQALRTAASEKEAWTILDKLGHHLLTKTMWMINGRPHVLLEVEAYLNSAKHPDPFTHSSTNQQHGGCWYFHSKGKSFNGGTYKGLDICIGFKEADSGVAYGGFLIRSIAELPSVPTKAPHLPSLSPIEGSCCVVDHLLRCFDAPSIQGLIDAHFTTRVPRLDGSSATSPETNLTLVPFADGAHPDVRVYTTPRVGLTLKRASDKTHFHRFLSRPYRYTTHPTIRKGRLQTVLGLSYVHALPVSRVAALSGVKEAKAREYISAFRFGRSKKPSKFYRTQLPTQQLCSALGACFDAGMACPDGDGAKNVGDAESDDSTNNGNQ
ncbi:hypothetical protein PTSG_07062 [Salpingoeca rosetta]|uniref:Uncharacterized protein n=1 Tax=Salpingoeca rosetta (strain ATCC 50818 / BSB-021) TaxID=946362 RepID=F2UDY1_SALR5|nr:uncharacterized protein PTSG_07062 [Salpingoeca rosetta]EGD74831.1 hypothetical protein PTSG_07062 [Salpingoeca rosetta]|eukprot:XP_004992476.1 hypothetical protein PTSG_07062 [Salpingoeca rosetta]